MTSISSSITPENVQRFLDILDRVAPAAAVSPPAPEASKPEAVADTEDKKEAETTGSVAKYKAVD
jgi:hypothetical protein